MKKLFDIKLQSWFENKQDTPFIAASVNPKYVFDVVRETEKAIQISIYKEREASKYNWKMWIPKSVIINLDEII